MVDVKKLRKKIILSFDIEVETGLHIGGTKETLKIGGVDTPVITDAFGRILIPGSSIKGKIRCLLERKSGKIDTSKTDRDGKIIGNPCKCGEENCLICKLFGPNDSKKIELVRRVIVRDFYLKDFELNESEVVDYLKKQEKYLSIKTENVIDRIKGTTRNGGIRQTQRVDPGAVFNGEIILDIYEEDNEKELLNKILEGLYLLRNDYLGGSGSRGYGKVKIKNILIKELDLGNFEEKKTKEYIIIEDWINERGEN